MLISETVYVDGVPAAPTSITAVLYRIVNGVRSPSGVTVTATATANTGEYTFAWTNGAWNRTDELELRVIPVIDSVSYPATIWRSHGSVDAAMRGTDSAMLASSYTAPPTTAAIADGVWDEARAGHTTAGTFGFYLDAAISSAGGGSGGLTATETAAAVWNALAATYNTADTMGAALGNVGGSVTDADWEQVRYRLGIDGVRTPPTEAAPVLPIVITPTQIISLDTPTPDEAGSFTIIQRDDYQTDPDIAPIGAIRIETPRVLLRPIDPPTLVFFAKQSLGRRYGEITFAGTAFAVAVDGEPNQYDLFIEITNAELDKPPGRYGWDIKAIYADGDRKTLVHGSLTVRDSMDPPPAI